jgi:hypothetical protein
VSSKKNQQTKPDMKTPPEQQQSAPAASEPQTLEVAHEAALKTPSGGPVLAPSAEAPGSNTPLKFAGLTGVAFTIQASNDTGRFPNFRICTLFLVDGQVEHIERSQEFAAFEAIARTEIFVNTALWNLSNRYAPGRFQGMGGDHQRDFIARITKDNPELLKKIAPALGLVTGKAEA